MKIPADIYDFDLFRWAMLMPVVTEEEVRLKNVLGRLCYRNVQELNLKAFTEDEKELMRQQGGGRVGEYGDCCADDG